MRASNILIGQSFAALIIRTDAEVLGADPIELRSRLLRVKWVEADGAFLLPVSQAQHRIGDLFPGCTTVRISLEYDGRAGPGLPSPQWEGTLKGISGSAASERGQAAPPAPAASQPNKRQRPGGGAPALPSPPLHPAQVSLGSGPRQPAEPGPLEAAAKQAAGSTEAAERLRVEERAAAAAEEPCNSGRASPGGSISPHSHSREQSPVHPLPDTQPLQPTQLLAPLQPELASEPPSPPKPKKRRKRQQEQPPPSDSPAGDSGPPAVEPESGAPQQPAVPAPPSAAAPEQEDNPYLAALRSEPSTRSFHVFCGEKQGLLMLPHTREEALTVSEPRARCAASWAARGVLLYTAGPRGLVECVAWSSECSCWQLPTSCADCLSPSAPPRLPCSFLPLLLLWPPCRWCVRAPRVRRCRIHSAALA